MSIDRSSLLQKLYAIAPRGEDLAGKTLLVTGASGQIGLHLLALALARGARVIASYNKTPMVFAHPNLEWVKYNLDQPQDFSSSHRIDALVHTAAIWLLPGALPHLVKSGFHRLIVFSSTSIFGKQTSRNIDEIQVVKRLQDAENSTQQLAKHYALDLTLLRPTMIYGLGMDANITRMARTILKYGFVPIFPPANGLRHPVQAYDLALAALTVLNNSKTYGNAYNLGGGAPLTYRAMIEKLFCHLGKKPHLITLPFLPTLLDIIGKLPALHINGEVARRMNSDLAFDPSPAITDFNYNPRAFLEGDVIL